MKKIEPNQVHDSIADISAEFILQKRKKALFIDVDNTLFLPKVALSEQDISLVDEKLSEWLNHGIKIVAISNNFSKDRQDYFNSLQIASVFFARKPLPSAFRKAYALLADDTIRKDEILHIGDQVLTDGIGAKLFGIEYFYIHPKNKKHDYIFTMPSRLIERCLGIKKKGDGYNE